MFVFQSGFYWLFIFCCYGGFTSTINKISGSKWVCCCVYCNWNCWNDWILCFGYRFQWNIWSNSWHLSWHHLLYFSGYWSYSISSYRVTKKSENFYFSFDFFLRFLLFWPYVKQSKTLVINHEPSIFDTVETKF